MLSSGCGVGEPRQTREVRDSRDDGDLGANLGRAEEASEARTKLDHPRDLTLDDLTSAAIGLVRVGVLVGTGINQ